MYYLLYFYFKYNIVRVDILMKGTFDNRESTKSKAQETKYKQGKRQKKEAGTEKKQAWPAASKMADLDWLSRRPT